MSQVSYRKNHDRLLGNAIHYDNYLLFYRSINDKAYRHLLLKEDMKFAHYEDERLYSFRRK